MLRRGRMVGRHGLRAATLSLPGAVLHCRRRRVTDHFCVPGGRIGAPRLLRPACASYHLPEIAVPYAGGTYYRNDSSGVPVLSNVPGRYIRYRVSIPPAYAMGATLAAQRPGYLQPGRHPRQTTFGGQAVDRGSLTQCYGVSDY